LVKSNYTWSVRVRHVLVGAPKLSKVVQTVGWQFKKVGYCLLGRCGLCT